MIATEWADRSSLPEQGRQVDAIDVCGAAGAPVDRRILMRQGPPLVPIGVVRCDFSVVFTSSGIGIDLSFRTCLCVAT